jgi:hypothetical protein
MGKILTMRNLKRYKSREAKLFSIRSMFSDMFPVLLRRFVSDDNFCWQRGKFLDDAIHLTLEILKYWKAFRNPPKSKSPEKNHQGAGKKFTSDYIEISREN